MSQIWNRSKVAIGKWSFVFVVAAILQGCQEKSPPSENKATGHDHAGHDHAHVDTAFLELSAPALLNLGLTPEFLKPVALTNYRKTVNVPAIIVERPGRTVIQVSTPMTGVITEIAAVQGATVEPGAMLFRIRLTHEELVKSQTDFVRALGELDVEKREITRLETASTEGAIAGKTLLERRYAKEKLEAHIKAQREALRIHGLSDRQVEQIAKERRLLSTLSIAAPSSTQEKPGELQLGVADDGHVAESLRDSEATCPTETHSIASRHSLVRSGAAFGRTRAS